MYFPASTLPAPGKARPYRRYDLVRCEECAHVFLAQGKHVSCRRCKSERLQALRR